MIRTPNAAAPPKLCRYGGLGGVDIHHVMALFLEIPLVFTRMMTDNATTDDKDTLIAMQAVLYATLEPHIPLEFAKENYERTAHKSEHMFGRVYILFCNR